jgi:hypothetical protein
MELVNLNRHFRHFNKALEFISQERHWFKEVLGDAYINYDVCLGELLELLKLRMKEFANERT